MYSGRRTLAVRVPNDPARACARAIKRPSANIESVVAHSVDRRDRRASSTILHDADRRGPSSGAAAAYALNRERGPTVRRSSLGSEKRVGGKAVRPSGRLRTASPFIRYKHIVGATCCGA